MIYIVLTVNTNKRTQTAYIKSLVETGVKCGGVPPGDRLREGVKWEKSASNMEVGLPPPAARPLRLLALLVWGPLTLEFI